MEHLDTATSVATWFDAFLKHGSIVSVLLSLFCGWGAAITASFPIHRIVKDDDLATFYARLTCMGFSFLITAGTWPNEWRWAWALTMCVMSPILGLLALSLLKKWKPDLADNMSMKKVTHTPPIGDME
jgi:hypothetical protein